MKHWTDGGLKVARESDNMKHWTNGGLEVAREIDNMKHWTDGGPKVAREIGNMKHSHLPHTHTEVRRGILPSHTHTLKYEGGYSPPTTHVLK